MCGGGGTGIAARERIFIARLLRAKLFLHNGVATKSSSVDVWSVIIDKIKCVFAVELTIAARLGATGEVVQSDPGRNGEEQAPHVDMGRERKHSQTERTKH